MQRMWSETSGCLQEATMPEPKNDEAKKPDPALDDVEPGSDADAKPVPEVGKTPPNPNERQ